MRISVLGVNKANLMDVITDESVYVICKDYFHSDSYKMRPIKDVDVKHLLSDEALIVRIRNE